jgi:hypothetical protein
MQVTAVYQGSEIGYGNGSHAVYAIEECIDSISTIYIDAALDDIQLMFTDVQGSGYPKWAMLTDFFYNERQYF